MPEKIKKRPLLKNYFLYLSVFTIEIIIVVLYFTIKNRDILINSALIEKYNLSHTYPEEFDALMEAYRTTISHYYLMAAIIILSVLFMAAAIHILMKKRSAASEKIDRLRVVAENSDVIKKSEQKYRSLFENNGNAIIVVATDEIITDCNRKFAELLGYNDISQIVNRINWKEVVHADDIQRVQGYDSLRRISPEKAPEEYTMKLLRKDGGFKHVIVSVIVTHDTEQLASIVDITELVKKDAALKEHENLLQQANEIASLGSWSYFAETKKLVMSDEFIKLVNISYEDISDMTIDILREKYMFVQFCDAVENALESGNSVDTEITYLNEKSDKSDKTVYFRLITGQDKFSKGKNQITGIIQDISNRKKIENEIRRANRDLKNLLYVATHDMQIPMVSIGGFAKILQRKSAESGLDKDTLDNIGRIVENVRKMNNILNNIFHVSGVKSFKQNFDTFDTVSIIDRAIEQVSSLKEKHSASIEIVNSPKIPNVHADRENFILLFRHLFSNALNHGGKNIRTGYNPEKGFYVQDDGTGMKKEDIERVFFRKDTEDGSSDGSGKNTLGLAFCRKIIDEHNGEIFAESEGVNKGLTVYFTLSKELIRD